MLVYVHFCTKMEHQVGVEHIYIFFKMYKVQISEYMFLFVKTCFWGKEIGDVVAQDFDRDGFFVFSNNHSCQIPF